MLVVLGSINADLLFAVDQLPMPGETVLCPAYEMAIGGKGSNQAAAAAKAGANTVFVGHVGNDAYGPVVKGMLADAGVDCGHLKTAQAPTAIAVIGVDSKGENSIIVASGANLVTSADQAKSFMQPGTTLLFQNEIRPDETFRAIRDGSAAGCRTILNLAPAGELPADVLAALDVLIVNEHEARSVAEGIGMNDADDIHAVADRLAVDHDLAVVLTLGSQGAYAAGKLGQHKVPALKVDAVDTTGAGDCFSGVLAARMDEDMAFETALRHASAAASLACLAVGAQTAQPGNAEIVKAAQNL